MLFEDTLFFFGSWGVPLALFFERNRHIKVGRYSTGGQSDLFTNVRFLFYANALRNRGYTTYFYRERARLT